MLEAASQYEGPQYWKQRHEIGNHMQARVRVPAEVWGSQTLLPGTSCSSGKINDESAMARE